MSIFQSVKPTSLFSFFDRFSRAGWGFEAGFFSLLNRVVLEIARGVVGVIQKVEYSSGAVETLIGGYRALTKFIINQIPPPPQKTYFPKKQSNKV